MSAPPPVPAALLPRHFRLGDWTVDPRAGQLQRGSETIRLEPKVMGVLKVLAAHAGEVVTRDELLDAVWPDVIVTENALSRCVSDLRRALDDDPRAPTLIETIPKTGYRLLLPVEPAEASAPPLVMGDGVPAWTDITGPAPSAHTPAPSRRSPWAWGVGLVALIALGLGFALRTQQPPPPALPTVETLRPITAMAGSEGLAAISPAGDRVAYVRLAEGRRTGHIEIVGTDGGTPLRLTEGPTDTYPVFAPDGQHLAFLRCERERCRPYRISTLGTDERPLAGPIAHPSGLTWSPDGRLLAYVEQASTASVRYLALLDLETGDRHRLTTPSATLLGDIFPAFSPDGSQLAFVRRTDAINGDLHIVSIDGGTPVAVSKDRSQIARFSWFPDGRTLLTASDRDGMFRLWRFATDGGPPIPLPLEVTQPIGPVLDATGDHLVVETWNLPIQLWHYDFTASDLTRHTVAPSTRWDRMPALSPDARHVAFVSTRSGHTELWIAGLDGSPPHRLTHLAGPSVQTPQWSPDGSTIAFLVRTDGQSDVYTVSAEGGVPQRLTSTDADEAHPRWAPDSRTLFVGRRRDDRWEGVRLSTDESVDTALIPDAVALAPSPDGRALWYVKENTQGIWSVPLTSEGLPESDYTPDQLVQDLAPNAPALWSVTQDGLVYVQQVGEQEALVRWTPLESETLLEGSPMLGLDLWAPALTVSSDGTAAILAQMDFPEIDILIAELGTP